MPHQMNCPPMTDLDALKREAEAMAKRMQADATGNPGGYCTGHDLRAYADLIQRLLPALEDARRLDALEKLVQKLQGFDGWKLQIFGPESDAGLVRTADPKAARSIREAIDSAMEKADESTSF